AAVVALSLVFACGTNSTNLEGESSPAYCGSRKIGQVDAIVENRGRPQEIVGRSGGGALPTHTYWGSDISFNFLREVRCKLDRLVSKMRQRLSATTERSRKPYFPY